MVFTYTYASVNFGLNPQTVNERTHYNPLAYFSAPITYSSILPSLSEYQGQIPAALPKIHGNHG